MSFSEDVRRELVARPPAKACCRLAFLSGLLRHAGSLQVRGGGEVAVVAELGDPAAARLAFSLVRERGAECEILSFREHRFERRNRVLVRILGARGQQLLHEAGVLTAGLAPLEQPPGRLLNRACCRSSYLRGAFVAAGSVSAPHRPAHLELRTAELESARGLAQVAGRDGIQMGTAERRGHAIAYLKGREAIRDLLATIGAHDAVLSFEEAQVISSTRESANRLTNCDRANLERTSAASHRQRLAIGLLDLDDLRPELRTVAELRLRFPDSSLAELGQRATPRMPKSTVARHMKTLISLTDS
jgi:cell division protein WhiA